MKYHPLHSWRVTPKEAAEIQLKLKPRVCLNNSFDKIKKIAGADVSYSGNKAIGGVVVFEFPHLKPVEKQFFISSLEFLYIPGLLTFREGPALLGALEKIRNEPDLILFDGQGTLHPKRMGIATHLGLLLNIPTIGCAKSKLIGEYSLPGEEKGSYTLIKDKEEIIGAAVRTKRRVKPVFISPGNKINLATSIEIVLECIRKYRLPEPLREAHLLVGAIKRKYEYPENL